LAQATAALEEQAPPSPRGSMTVETRGGEGTLVAANRRTAALAAVASVFAGAALVLAALLWRRRRHQGAEAAPLAAAAGTKEEKRRARPGDQLPVYLKDPDVVLVDNRSHGELAVDPPIAGAVHAEVARGDPFGNIDQAIAERRIPGDKEMPIVLY